MTLKSFCKKLAKLQKLTAAQKALAILWFLDGQSPGIEKTASELASIMKAERIGNPNTNWLAGQIGRTGCTFKKGIAFRLRENRKSEIRSWIEAILDGAAVEIEFADQYLPEPLWKNTRGYIEKVCTQLNGCIYYGYYDAGAVLIRRLVETLIIECYEHLHRAEEIQDTSGNYLMLSGLVDKCIDTNGLTIGREAKKALKKIKELGDRSAHNRRYNARKPDLDEIREGLRVTCEELFNIANLYSRRP